MKNEGWQVCKGGGGGRVAGYTCRSGIPPTLIREAARELSSSQARSDVALPGWRLNFVKSVREESRSAEVRKKDKECGG